MQRWQKSLTEPEFRLLILQHLRQSLLVLAPTESYLAETSHHQVVIRIFHWIVRKHTEECLEVLTQDVDGPTLYTVDEEKEGE